ncbi:Mitotic spindle assembly checkpoint protein MAD2B [Phytophthora nicotianae]|uniref:Mitotic spindle assembly checkpoint protein MAD2B n=1 Tax=Phytophthora nicotianae TaxID=4792 RepID=A0A0W8C6W6_PHYNI|nr:Mitotic spindle assembly checkpoint protein MAD2B [Phytophthora nicotianae]
MLYFSSATRTQYDAILLYVEAFEQRVLYDVPIHMCRHPLLCEYIHSMLTGCRPWLLRGELENICVILLSKEGRTVETLVIEPGWSATFVEEAASDEDYQLPLVQLEEAFRAGMVALVATSAPNTGERTDSAKPNTFRIFAQTVEDATNRGTAVNDDSVSNSWVLADPIWCEDQKKQKEIFPVKSIHSEASPIRLNVYMKSEEPASAMIDKT